MNSSEKNKVIMMITGLILITNILTMVFLYKHSIAIIELSYNVENIADQLEIDLK